MGAAPSESGPGSMGAPRPGPRAASPRVGIGEAWRSGPEPPKTLMEETLNLPDEAKEGEVWLIALIHSRHCPRSQ